MDVCHILVNIYISDWWGSFTVGSLGFPLYLALDACCDRGNSYLPFFSGELLL